LVAYRQSQHEQEQEEQPVDSLRSPKIWWLTFSGPHYRW